MPSSLSRYRHYGNTHGKSKTLTSGDLTSFMYQVARGMDFLTSRGVSAIVVDSTPSSCLAFVSVHVVGGTEDKTVGKWSIN